VIVGAGFGGLAAAGGLANAPADVVVVDRSNHHLFQPLLYQVATAGLAPTQIASPVRGILARQANARVLLGEVTGVDVAAKQVRLAGRALGYDQLILATGASHGYFGHDERAAWAPGLKTLDDALELRRRVLLAFERAELAEDEASRERLLSFAIIGAGPTGVELAGAIAELARRALTRDFRAIRGRMAKVFLVEAGSRVLPTFPEPLSDYARRALEGLGVTVCLGEAVAACNGCGVTLGGEVIPAGTTIWAAGVMASPAAEWLQVTRDRAGRTIVARDLSVPGAPDVFVIGDAAHVDEAGAPLPGLAPVAKQQGAYVARVISARLSGATAPAPFRYRSSGSLATVGRKAAVVATGRLQLKGPVAWLLWSVAHIWFLIGFRNRIAVALDWVWAYLTFERGARLITGCTRGAAGCEPGSPMLRAAAEPQHRIVAPAENAWKRSPGG
jgi:NADH dehydrogenase